ncbi:cellulose binding domain-containing protein [Streptomyces collinus]
MALTYASQCITNDRAARRLVSALSSHPQAQESPTTEGLPVVPRLLLHILCTAGAWRRLPGRARLLHPDFVAWIDISEARTQASGLALRSLRDMSAFDAELLWWSQVEAFPAQPLATALGWCPEYTARVVQQVVQAYTERCRANHLGDARRQPCCRSYAGLLEAAVRRNTGEPPQELQEHLAGCTVCSELSQCLHAAHEGRLGEVIAAGVLDWGGAAYAAARRIMRHRAPTPAGPHKARRRSYLPLIAATTAVMAVAVTAVVVSDSYPHDETSTSSTTPSLFEPPGGGNLPAPPAVTSRPPTHDITRLPKREKLPPEEGPSVSDQPSTSGSPRARDTGTSQPPAPAACTSDITVAEKWGSGAKVNLSVVTRAAVSDWQLTFHIAQGTTIRDTWNGYSSTDGRLVTVTPADYNTELGAGGSLDVGFVYDGSATAADWITDVTLDGHPCAPS